MKNKDITAEMETLFLALADKTRLRLLNLMRKDEVCVLHFTEVMGENQPKISRHLAYLRNAEIVSARRAGKWINYKIEFPQNPFVACILRQTLESLAAQSDMREDYEKLLKISGAAAVKIVTDVPLVSAQANMSRQDKEELEVFLL